MQLQEEISRLTRQHFDRAPDQCDDHQLYQALLILARQRAQARPAPTGDRKLYYFSAEFLLGKLLSNQLLALGLYQPSACSARCSPGASRRRSRTPGSNRTAGSSKRSARSPSRWGIPR